MKKVRNLESPRHMITNHNNQAYFFPVLVTFSPLNDFTLLEKVILNHHLFQKLIGIDKFNHLMNTLTFPYVWAQTLFNR